MLAEALKGAISPEEMQAKLSQQKREQQEQAAELSRMLQQQSEELNATRDELDTTKSSLKREQDNRKKAEQKAQDADTQLSVQRVEHQKLQKHYELERSASQAAKARLKAANVDEGAEDSGGGGAYGSNPEMAAELQRKEESEKKLKDQLQSMKAELERVTRQHEALKSKQEQTGEQQRLKKKEWERERLAMKRQLENTAAEVAKRDQWLAKAKGIITEYQKRNVPANGTPTAATPSPRQ